MVVVVVVVVVVVAVVAVAVVAVAVVVVVEGFTFEDSCFDERVCEHDDSSPPEPYLFLRLLLLIPSLVP